MQEDHTSAGQYLAGGVDGTAHHTISGGYACGSGGSACTGHCGGSAYRSSTWNSRGSRAGSYGGCACSTGDAV